MLSRKLRIRVMEGAVRKVDVTLPAGALRGLPRLVPEKTLEKLRRRSVDIAQITKTALANDGSPGELFALEDGEKVVRVWLE